MKMSKTRAIVITVIAFIALLLFVINTFIIPSVIRNQLDSLNPGGLTISADRIHAGFFKQSLKFSGVQINDPEGKFNGSIKQVKFIGINIGSYIVNNRFKAHSLEVTFPEIKISKDFQPDTTSQPEKKKKAQLKALIKKVDIENSLITYVGNAEENDSILFASLNLHIEKLQISPEQAEINYKQFGIDELQLEVSNLHYLTNDENYRIELGVLNFSTKTKDLNTQEFKLVPLKDKYEIGNIAGKQTDWFNINLKHLNLEGINLEKLLQKQEFWFAKLELDSLQMEAFRDVRLPMGPKPDTKLPGDLIAGIPLPIHCDSLCIANANIRYTERAKESTEAGHVDFTGLQAVSSNFTNIDSLLNEPVSLDVKARLFGQAMMTAKLSFASKRFPDANRATGLLAPMSFTAFNSMVEPALSAKILRGMIHRMTFDFTYNNDTSHGKLLLDYDNAKVEVMKRENHKNKKLESMLLNIIVHEHNLPDSKQYREGTIEFERDKKKSYFNFWWKSLLSGIKSVMVR